MRKNDIIECVGAVSSAMAEYLPRLVDDTLKRLLGELPAVVLVGPRACGKTTTAMRQAASVVRLD